MASKKGSGKDPSIKKFEDNEDETLLSDETGPLFEFDVEKAGDPDLVEGSSVPAAGIGPDCAPGERGESDKVECMFDKNAECLANYYQAVTDCVVATKIADAMPSYARTQVADRQGVGGIKTCEEKADEQKERCKKQAKKDCTCQESIFTFCTDPNGCDPNDPNDPDVDDPVDPPDDPGDDPDDPGDGDGPTTDGPRLTNVPVTQSTYGAPIELVWGRYIVGGNMFWMSDLKTATYTSRDRPDDDLDAVESTTLISRQYFDMAVGICRGSITSIVRIWLGDALIYAGALPTNEDGEVINVGASSVYNVSSLLPGSRTYVNLGQVVPRFTLYGGTGTQKRNPKMSRTQGATSTPAYRDLAYLLIEDLNIGLLGGTFPAFRFEVYNAVEESTKVARLPLTNLDDNPAPAVDYNNVNRDFLALDVSRGTLYAGSRNVPSGVDALKVIDYSQMTEKLSAAPGGFNFASHNCFVLKSGLVLGQAANNPREITHLYNAAKNQVIDSYGLISSGAGHLEYNTYGVVGLPDKGNALASMLTYDVDGLPREAVIVPASANGDTHVFVYDPYARTVGRQGTWYTPFVAGKRVLAAVPSYRDLLSGSTPYRLEGWHHFEGSASGATSAISVGWFTVHSTLTQRQFELFTYIEEMGVIDSSWYGDQTSGVTIPMAYQSLNGAYIMLLVRTLDSSYIVRWNTALADVDFSFEIPQYPAWSSANHRRIPFPDESGFIYISATGDVVSVDLINARYEVLYTLASAGLPAIEGAQLFDPREQALTYIAAASGGTRTIMKFFPERLAATPVNLGAIVRSICELAGIAPDLIDVSDLTDIVVGGYAISGTNTGADILRQLVELFGIRAFERGDTLTFTLPADTASILTVPHDDLLITDSNDISLQHTRRDATATVSNIKLTTADIDNFCKEKILTLSLEDTTDDTRVVQRQAPIVLGQDELVDAGLRVLEEINLGASEIVMSFGPKHHRLTPSDILQTTAPDGTVYTGFVRNTVMSTAFIAKHTAREHIPTVFDNVRPSTDIWSRTGAGRSTDGALRNTKAYPIMVPAILDDHRDTSDLWPIYAAVDAPGDDFTQAVTPKVRLHQTIDTVDSGYVDTPSLRQFYSLGTFRPGIDKPAYIGTLLTPPLAVTNPQTTDMTSAMVIRFDRAQVTQRFVSGLTLVDLLNDTSKNLLIVGRELIQFRDWSVAGDGRTVTFTTLLRGRNGTDCYVAWHPIIDVADGATRDLCFLYTPDTIKPAFLPAQMGTLFANLFVDEGAPTFTADENISSVVYAPGDSLRFWGPGEIARFDAAHAPTATNWDVTFRWKRRIIRTMNEFGPGEGPLENPVERYRFLLIPSGGLNIRELERDLRRGRNTYIRFDSGPITTPEYVMTVSRQTSVFLSTSFSTFRVVILQERTVNGTGGPTVWGLPGYAVFPPDVAYPLP